MQRKIALLMALSFILTACGGSNKSNTDPPTSGPLTGNWQMSLQSSNTNLKPNPQSGFLVQNQNVITGSVSVTDSPCSGVGTVDGTVTGAAVSLVVNPTGIQLNLSGTLGSDMASMSGNYTILSSGCSGSQTAPQTGIWTANLVAPLNGNMQGTFTSTQIGTSYSVAGQVSQGPNTGISNAALTGNFGATGYCFTTANIVGVISGTSVVINLMGSDGITQIGQMNVTSSFDGKSLTGRYNILPMGPGFPPCGDGDSGTVTLSL